MNSLAQAMKDLLDERVRQVAWWGVEVGKPDAAFHLVLAEEVGEAARAVLAIDPNATPEDLDRLEALYGEVVQVTGSVDRLAGGDQPVPRHCRGV